MKNRILQAFTAYYNESSQLDIAQLEAYFKKSPIPNIKFDNLLKAMSDAKLSDKSVRYELDAIVFPLIDNTSNNEQLRFLQAMQKHVYEMSVEISKIETESKKETISISRSP